METAHPPPSYSQQTAHSPSIVEIRKQIVANGAVLFPFGYSKDLKPKFIKPDKPLVVVAKMSGEQDQNRPTNKPFTKAWRTPVKLSKVPPAKSTGAATATSPPEKHYATLLRVGAEIISSRKVYILLRGEPRDTVFEALENLLETTEQLMHQLLLHNAIEPEDQ